MLFANWKVCIVKHCDQGFENAIQEHRLRTAFSSLMWQFFTLWNNPKLVNIFILCPNQIKNCQSRLYDTSSLVNYNRPFLTTHSFQTFYCLLEKFHNVLILEDFLDLFISCWSTHLTKDTYNRCCKSWYVQNAMISLLRDEIQVKNFIYVSS